MIVRWTKALDSTPLLLRKRTLKGAQLLQEVPLHPQWKRNLWLKHNLLALNWSNLWQHLEFQPSTLPKLLFLKAQPQIFSKLTLALKRREHLSTWSQDSRLKKSNLIRLKSLKCPPLQHLDQLSAKRCSHRISNSIANALMHLTISCRTSQRVSYKSLIWYSSGLASALLIAATRSLLLICSTSMLPCFPSCKSSAIASKSLRQLW